MRQKILPKIACITAIVLAAALPAAAQSALTAAAPDRPAVMESGGIVRTGEAWRSDSGNAGDPARSIGCSASTCLRQATLNNAGHSSVSLSYALNASLGQESVTGCSSSYHYVLQSGFWGRYGSLLVPVVLMVTKAPGDPDRPKLDWSGNNAPYAVYRATTCSRIFDGYYDSTPLKTYVDETPPASALTCYNILATAPGRSAGGFSPEMNGSVLTVGPGY